MMTKRVALRVVGFVAVPMLAWLMPAMLLGQATSIPAATAAVMPAAQLVTMAEELSSTPARFQEAGVLLDRAGRQLPVEDPASVGLLVRAARLHYFGGALEQARSAMKEAGWRALGQGHVRTAANAYADAALIALAQDDKAAATDLVAIVKLLEEWPGVTVADRRQIRSRIVG